MNIEEQIRRTVNKWFIDCVDISHIDEEDENDLVNRLTKLLTQQREEAQKDSDGVLVRYFGKLMVEQEELILRDFVKWIGEHDFEDLPDVETIDGVRIIENILFHKVEQYLSQQREKVTNLGKE